jgi:hypothetical protein
MYIHFKKSKLELLQTRRLNLDATVSKITSFYYYNKIPYEDLEDEAYTWII